MEELALIHERVIAETGGVQGIMNPGGLESALARPFTAFGEVELFPNLSYIKQWVSGCRFPWLQADAGERL